MPTWIVVGLLGAYATVVGFGFPVLEKFKSVKPLGTWVALRVRPEDHVGGYRLDRWTWSWRFYTDHPTQVLETPDDLERFFARPGRHYCLMLRRHYADLSEHGLPRTKVVADKPGLFVTTGRKLRTVTDDERLVHFVLITDAGVSSD